MAKYIDIAIFFVLCVASQAYGATVNCTQAGAGRFADTDDPTCQNYTYCVYNRAANTYLSYDYKCPTTSVFNPNTRLCTDPSNYVCVVATTTIAPTTITTEATTITTEATTTVSVPTCTADGFVLDPSSTNCTSYIQCVEINGTFTETPIDCPPDTFYNPNSTLCETDYNCTDTATTVVATTTVATTTEVTSTEAATTAAPFSCSVVGRFPNPADTNCKTYYYCVATTTGGFAQYLYTCPSTSVFSPTSRLCTANYVCPS